MGILLVGLLVCSPTQTAAQTSQPAVRHQDPVTVCEIVDPRLDEASGLAASRRNPGYYYTHNDSQGPPHVYVLDRTGRICLTIRLVGAQNFDWEDISLAPGENPNTYEVCVADIGDNQARRPEVVIYRFPEPEISAAARGRGTIDVKPKVFRCKYEDGARDAEAFAADPTGVGWVFSKRFDGACDIYRLALPWKASGVNTLRRGGSLRFAAGALPLATMVTAADISPDGQRLVTRSYLGGWEWRLPQPSPAGGFARIFEQPAAALKLAVEPQGEALCFSADGRALLTVSEGTPTRLYEMRAVKRAERERP